MIFKVDIKVNGSDLLKKCIKYFDALEISNFIITEIF